MLKMRTDTRPSTFYWAITQHVCMGILLLIGSACGSSFDESPSGSIGTDGELVASIPIEVQSHLCPTGTVTAEVIVDGGTPQDLLVDCAAGTISGQIDNLLAGTHTFTINYYIDGVLVATSSTTAEIVAGEMTVVFFDDTMITLVGGNWNEINWNQGNWSGS